MALKHWLAGTAAVGTLGFFVMHFDNVKTTDEGIDLRWNVKKAMDSAKGAAQQVGKVAQTTTVAGLEATAISAGRIMHRTVELAKDMPASEETTITPPAPQPAVRPDPTVDNAMNPAQRDKSSAPTVINGGQQAPAAQPVNEDAMWQKMKPGVYMQDDKTCVLVHKPLQHPLTTPTGETIAKGVKPIQHMDSAGDCKRAEAQFKGLPPEKGIVEIIVDKWNSASQAYNAKQRAQRDLIDEEGYPVPQGPGSLKDTPPPVTDAGQALLRQRLEASTAVSPCYTVHERVLFIFPVERTVCPGAEPVYHGGGNVGWSGGYSGPSYRYNGSGYYPGYYGHGSVHEKGSYGSHYKYKRTEDAYGVRYKEYGKGKDRGSYETKINKHGFGYGYSRYSGSSSYGWSAKPSKGYRPHHGKPSKPHVPSKPHGNPDRGGGYRN